MVLPEKGTCAGFHTHGTRGEQEIFVDISDEGEYLEIDDWASEPNHYPLLPGTLATTRGVAFHSVINRSDQPLVIFVVTTNEP